MSSPCRSAVGGGIETPDSGAAGEATTPSGQPLLQLYNSMSRSKEAFTPRADQGDKVSMYVCGVTVYSHSHIGALALLYVILLLALVPSTFKYCVILSNHSHVEMNAM